MKSRLRNAPPARPWDRAAPDSRKVTNVFAFKGAFRELSCAYNAISLLPRRDPLSK